MIYWQSSYLECDTSFSDDNAASLLPVASRESHQLFAGRLFVSLAETIEAFDSGRSQRSWKLFALFGAMASIRPPAREGTFTPAPLALSLSMRVVKSVNATSFGSAACPPSCHGSVSFTQTKISVVVTYVSSVLAIGPNETLLARSSRDRSERTESPAMRRRGR